MCNLYQEVSLIPEAEHLGRSSPVATLGQWTKWRGQENRFVWEQNNCDENRRLEIGLGETSNTHSLVKGVVLPGAHTPIVANTRRPGNEMISQSILGGGDSEDSDKHLCKRRPMRVAFSQLSLIKLLLSRCWRKFSCSCPYSSLGKSGMTGSSHRRWFYLYSQPRKAPKCQWHSADRRPECGECCIDTNWPRSQSTAGSCKSGDASSIVWAANGTTLIFLCQIEQNMRIAGKGRCQRRKNCQFDRRVFEATIPPGEIIQLPGHSAVRSVYHHPAETLRRKTGRQAQLRSRFSTHRILHR